MASESIGTRTRQTRSATRADQGSQTRSYTRDLGMSKRVASTMTYTGANARISAFNGAFSTWQPYDAVLSQGTSLNNGYFRVLSIDPTNAAWLVVDPPPKDEGPLIAVVRTP